MKANEEEDGGIGKVDGHGQDGQHVITHHFTVVLPEDGKGRTFGSNSNPSALLVARPRLALLLLPSCVLCPVQAVRSPLARVLSTFRDLVSNTRTRTRSTRLALASCCLLCFLDEQQYLELVRFVN